MITTERYIILIGEDYYPSGWDDFAGTADTLEDAKKLVDEKFPRTDDVCGYWASIIDLFDHSELSYEPGDE